MRLRPHRIDAGFATRIAGRVLFGTLIALTAALTAHAGKLHLDSGGVIEARNWWIEGDWLYYDNGSGEIGVPRSIVVRIEGQPTTEPEPPTRKPWTASPAPAAEPRANVRRIGQLSGNLSERLDQAHAALRNRNYEVATADYLALINDQPDLHPARIGYAICEMALGRDGMAISVILDGLARAPDNPELNEILGDLRNREERVPEALALWKEAHRLAPHARVQEKIAKAQRELSAAGNYDLAATSHFNVRYDGNVDRSLANQVMTYLEDQYWELSDRFRHAPPQPITVLLYPEREFREVTQTPDWVGGIYDGKIHLPLAGLHSLNGRAKGLLAHELTHAVLHSKTRGQCPQWLHEGLAQMSEGRRLAPGDERAVRQMLAEGDPATWATRDFSYPAALAFTRFLESRRGMGGLVWTLDLLGEGLSLDESLRKTYGLNYADLCRRWAESVSEGRR